MRAASQSSQAVNVRPTGTQRSKGNMAASADQQINDMKEIVAKRPVCVWTRRWAVVTDFSTSGVGSQDPDAQRFRAARTIAGDHLAGTFGGTLKRRALNALDSAIGHFKDNPTAITSGLNQLQAGGSLVSQGGAGSHGWQPTRIRGLPRLQKWGQSEGGYRFKGGDPAKQENWEKVK